MRKADDWEHPPVADLGLSQAVEKHFLEEIGFPVLLIFRASIDENLSLVVVSQICQLTDPRFEKKKIRTLSLLIAPVIHFELEPPDDHYDVGCD